MTQQLLQSSTQDALVFYMTDSADHLTGKTGLTVTVTLSKNGGSFAAAAGAVTEIGSGWYKVAGNATDTNTLGHLLLHATASGADATDMMFYVSATDPRAALATASAVATLTAYVDTEVAAILAAVDTEIAAIKAKTDSLTFTVAGVVDANIQRINDVTITGNGQSGSEFNV